MPGELTRDDLHGVVLQVLAKGLCDLDATRASAARAEWRPSQPLLHVVLADVAEASR